MNDTPVLPKIEPADLANPEIVKVLESALKRVRAGEVAGVVVILAHGPDALSTSVAGSLASTLLAGCQQMTNQLLDALFNRQKRSSILMPQRRG